MSVQINNLQKSNLSERTEYKWNSFYRALVIDAHDLRQLGRVKVRIPDLMPETEDDACGEWKEKGLWAHPANNYLGGRNLQDMTGERANFEDGWYQGSCLIPPEGSWVFIFFENGDPNHPYYFGAGDYGQRKVLPENQQGPDWEKKWTLIKTRMGRCIIISDDEDDCRVEITGKKRQISNPPDGDDASVFTIDGNQTVIFLDERDGKENLLIKDYRGNYIRMHIDNTGIKDQLHIYFQDDIHIETLKNLLIKTGEKMDLNVGTAFKCTAGTTIDVKATTMYNEAALMMNRFASITDIRTAGVSMNDTAGVLLSSTAGVAITETSGVNNDTAAGVKIAEDSGVKIDQKSMQINDFALVSAKYHGIAMSSLTAEGPVSVMGAITKIQCDKPIPSIFAPMIMVGVPILAKTANKAAPQGDRNQAPNPQGIPDPVHATGDSEYPETNITTPPTGDDYMLTFENQPIKPVTPVVIPPAPQVPFFTGGGATPTPEEPEECPLEGGVGHLFALQLKDEYRDKIVPLVDKSYGKYTGFSLFRDPGYYQDDSFLYRMDTSYFDPAVVPVYQNYRDPTDWIIDEESKWWTNLDEFCKQVKNYDMTLVPTLLDFHASSLDPFITKLPSPYTGANWNEDIQGKYIETVMKHIKDSGVKYIINIGYRAYTLNELKSYKLKPDSVYLRYLFNFLINDCGITSSKISLSANREHNLFDKNPYCRYQMYTGDIIPHEDQLNNEEYVDSHWGGTGRVAVYNEDNELIDGYVYYLQHACYGIPVMSHWKMTAFENRIPDIYDSANVMNYIFAPNQREAMRIVYGDNVNNNGFIDFS